MVSTSAFLLVLTSSVFTNGFFVNTPLRNTNHPHYYRVSSSSSSSSRLHAAREKAGEYVSLLDSDIIPSVSTSPPVIDSVTATTTRSATEAVAANAKETAKSLSDFVSQSIQNNNAAAATQTKSLAEYAKSLNIGIVQVDPNKVTPSADFDRVAVAKDKLELIKQNSVQWTMGGSGGSGGGVNFDTSNIREALANNRAALTANNADMANAIKSFCLDTLHMNEYAPWYVVGITAILVISQKTKDNNNEDVPPPPNGFQLELTKAQDMAEEAADAADRAASGARTARDIAFKIQAKADPKSATSILDKTKVEALEVENKMVKKELEKSKAEIKDLKIQLQKYLGEEEEGVVVSPKTATKTTKKTATTTVMERDPSEDKRILEVVKEMDKENANSGGRTTAPAAKFPSFKTPEFEAAEAKAESGKAAVEAKAAAAKAASPRPTPADKASAQAEAAKAEVAKAGVEAKNDAAKVTAAGSKASPAVKPSAKAKAEAAKATAAKKAETAAKAKATAAKKAEEAAKAKSKAKAAAAAAAVKKAPASPPASPPKTKTTTTISSSSSSNPWGELKPSTLKRKTIAELKEYLTERNVGVTDDAGKVLKKADLIAAVQSL